MDRSRCYSQAYWPSWSKFLFTVGFQFASQSLDLLRVPAFLILVFSVHVVFLSKSFQTLFYDVYVLHQINGFAHVKPLQSKP